MISPASLQRVRAVADAVLYEGYLLYPYRASSSKNQSRWQFGVLGPSGAAESGVGEEPRMSCQTLMRAGDGSGGERHPPLPAASGAQHRTRGGGLGGVRSRRRADRRGRELAQLGRGGGARIRSRHPAPRGVAGRTQPRRPHRRRHGGGGTAGRGRIPRRPGGAHPVARTRRRDGGQRRRRRAEPGAGVGRERGHRARRRRLGHRTAGRGSLGQGFGDPAVADRRPSDPGGREHRVRLTPRTSRGGGATRGHVRARTVLPGAGRAAGGDGPRPGVADHPVRPPRGGRAERRGTVRRHRDRRDPHTARHDPHRGGEAAGPRHRPARRPDHRPVRPDVAGDARPDARHPPRSAPPGPATSRTRISRTRTSPTWVSSRN